MSKPHFPFVVAVILLLPILLSCSEKETATDSHHRGVTALEEYNEGIADSSEAIRLDLRDPGNWGIAFNETGDNDRAIADYTVAIRLAPQNHRVYNNRGNAYSDKSEFDKAIADYNEAIRLHPSDAASHNDLAWVLATCPDPAYRDGNQAVASATKACELTEWQSDDTVGTLAAAYAEAEDFNEAVKWQTKAHSMYSEEGQREWGFLLDLYKSGKAYHETPKE